MAGPAFDVVAVGGARVLDTEDAVIPGLFAAGGLFYHNHPGCTGPTAGSVSGEIAGEPAAQHAAEHAPHAGRALRRRP